MNKKLQSGSCTLVLGSFYYKDFLEEKPNKLLKITNVVDLHNEFKYLDKIRKIDNYKNYYTIPDEMQYLLTPSDSFYSTIKTLILSMEDKPNHFDGYLYCNYIDNAGDKDMQQTVTDLFDKDFTFWKSYKVIYKFITKIMEGFNYLHQNKLCHLDIKPENIMVDTNKCEFRIIDFGFCDIEPFNTFIKNPTGTLEYFPKLLKNTLIKPWLPQILANDMVLVNKKLPIYDDYLLVYKIDSFGLGRTLNFLKYIYDDNKQYSCYSNEKKLGLKLNNIIDCLLEKDVYKRYFIKDCIDEYID